MQEGTLHKVKCLHMTAVTCGHSEMELFFLRCLFNSVLDFKHLSELGGRILQ